MSQMKHSGWSVVMAGTGINLALGILYTWSIFKGAIKTSIEQGGPFQWDLASINDPYAVCCLVFAFGMILAGKVQDKFGPRITALVGGLLVAAGFIVVSQTADYLLWVLGFGVITGTGLAFGYSAALPPALKWFPPAKTGLIAGIVVSGFGLASVYIAPLSAYLLATYGLQTSMLFFGVAFAFVVGALSMLLINPPKDHLFGAAAAKTQKTLQAAPSAPAQGDFTPSQMMKTSTFYILWLLYFIGAGAGLMVIGSIAGMAKVSMGELAFLAVAILAIGNAAGRIVAGSMSDKIGRVRTLFIMLGCQATLMFLTIPVISTQTPNAVLLVLVATFIGFNYGTNLALFPALTKDFWGLKNFGANYGLLFTSWGVGGFVMARASQMIQAQTGSLSLSFAVAGTLLTVAAVITLTLKDLKAHQAQLAREEAAKSAGETPRPVLGKAAS